MYIARIEIGALTYSTDSYLGDKPAVALAVLQRPGANALSMQAAIANTMAELKKDFLRGIEYDIGYNPTAFIGDSIHELVKTIYEAMVLVIVAVVVFLQGWRPSVIPILAIPVSLVGTTGVPSLTPTNPVALGRCGCGVDYISVPGLGSAGKRGRRSRRMIRRPAGGEQTSWAGAL